MLEPQYYQHSNQAQCLKWQGSCEGGSKKAVEEINQRNIWMRVLPRTLLIKSEQAVRDINLGQQKGQEEIWLCPGSRNSTFSLYRREDFTETQLMPNKGRKYISLSFYLFLGPIHDQPEVKRMSSEVFTRLWVISQWIIYSSTSLNLQF